jgi:hypothetical protein
MIERQGDQTMKTNLMMMVLMMVLLSALLLAACGAPSTPPTVPVVPTSIPTSPPSVLPTMPASPLNPGSDSSTAGQDAAVANSRADLAARLNIDPSVITVVSVEAVDWPDGCLGIQTPGVMCTMVITPGYRVILEANGKQYEYHTNASGDVAHLASVTP